jgi:4-hydroxyphenylpyruvate dioxygenase
LRRIGYSGWVSLELMNPVLWRANARQVAEIAYTSLRKTLGLGDAPASWSARPH